MIYTKWTKLAMQIAYKAHIDQVDKSGLPYLYHPIHLAEQMDDEASICVALLHDVVEDSHYTIRDLENMGFSPAILEALSLLSHHKETVYSVYIRHIKANALARKVKIADLKHNAEIERLDFPTIEDIRRREKYHQAICVLESDQDDKI